LCFDQVGNRFLHGLGRLPTSIFFPLHIFFAWLYPWKKSIPPPILNGIALRFLRGRKSFVWINYNVVSFSVDILLKKFTIYFWHIITMKANHPLWDIILLHMNKFMGNFWQNKNMYFESKISFFLKISFFGRNGISIVFPFWQWKFLIKEEKTTVLHFFQHFLMIFPCMWNQKN